MKVSLFKRGRDAQLLLSVLFTVPAFWVFSPDPTLLSLLGIALFDWLMVIVVYAFNRLTEAEQRQIAPAHKAVLALLFVAFFPCLALLPNDVSRIAAVASMFNGLIYSFRFRRPGKPPFQLKSLYLVKPLMVCSSHSLQWIIFTGRLDAVILLFTLWHFFDLFVMTSLLDIPDRQEDEAAGVKTFAVVHGVERTYNVALVANLVCIAAGAAIIWLTGSWPLVLFLFPRAIVTHRRLIRLRARKVARTTNPLLLRALGLIGILAHWWWY